MMNDDNNNRSSPPPTEAAAAPPPPPAAPHAFCTDAGMVPTSTTVPPHPPPPAPSPPPAAPSPPTAPTIATAPAPSPSPSPPPVVANNAAQQHPQPPRQQQWMMPHLPPPTQPAPAAAPQAVPSSSLLSQHQQQHQSPSTQRPVVYPSYQLHHHQQQQRHANASSPVNNNNPPAATAVPQPYAVGSSSAAAAGAIIAPPTVPKSAPAVGTSAYPLDVDSEVIILDDTHSKQQRSPNANARRKRPHCMALSYLQGQCCLVEESSSDIISAPARKILRQLLDDQKLTLKESEEDVETALAHVAHRWPPQNTTTCNRKKKTVHKNIGMDRTLQLAKLDQLSYLGSFLAVIEEASTGQTPSFTVSALDLIKRCCLAIHPSKIPPLMDAEEMAIAALEFLASTCTTTSTSSSSNSTLPNLPLIRFTKYESDVRKRSYEKVGTWKLADNDEFMHQVTALEDVFLSDATDYRFLRRGVCGPRMTTSAAEDALLLRGKVKASSTAAKRKPSVAAAGAARKQAMANAAAATVAAAAANANASSANHPLAPSPPTLPSTQGPLSTSMMMANPPAVALDVEQSSSGGGAAADLNPPTSSHHSASYPQPETSYE